MTSQKQYAVLSGLLIAACIVSSGGCSRPEESNLRVGLIDTGVDIDSVSRTGLEVVQKSQSKFDTTHGTVVATTFSRALNRGLSEITLYSYPAVDAGGSGSPLEMQEAIQEATADDVTLLIISMAANDPDPVIEKALMEAEKSGMQIIAAAGNTSGQRSGYPARYDQVASVGATDRYGVALSTSAYFDVDVWVRGDSGVLPQELKDKKYSGTSLAVAVYGASQLDKNL